MANEEVTVGCDALSMCGSYCCGDGHSSESILLGKGHGHSSHKNESHRSSHENEMERLKLDEDVEWRILKTGHTPTPPHKRHKQYSTHQAGKKLKK